MMQGTTTLFQEIGGQPALMEAIERFYGRVLAEPSLARFFAGVPMQRQKGHMGAFLALALGGPDRYHGRPMREAYAGLGITTADFTRVAELLVETLTEMGVAQDLIDRIVAGVAPVHDAIVGA